MKSLVSSSPRAQKNNRLLLDTQKSKLAVFVFLYISVCRINQLLTILTKLLTDYFFLDVV